MAQIVIGVDVHKRSHTLVAVSTVGQDLAGLTVDATSSGHHEALQWARSNFPGNRLWGVEDLRTLSSGLVAALTASGEAVVRVHPRLTARYRRTARTHGKSDPIDALAIARAVLRETDLPTAKRDEVALAVKLLVDRRQDLVAMRTATMNRLLDRWHELEPEEAQAPRLRYAAARQALSVRLHTHVGILANLARDELVDLEYLSQSIAEVSKRLEVMVHENASALLRIEGCGPLSAAKIFGETAGIDRFSTEAKYARFCGVAPTPLWSSNAPRFVSARYGNRQINSALHTIAINQIRRSTPGRDYYRRRIDGGATHSNAVKCLKRMLCRVVFTCLAADRTAPTIHDDILHIAASDSGQSVPQVSEGVLGVGMR